MVVGRALPGAAGGGASPAGAAARTVVPETHQPGDPERGVGHSVRQRTDGFRAGDRDAQPRGADRGDSTAFGPDAGARGATVDRPGRVDAAVRGGPGGLASSTDERGGKGPD